MITIGLHTAKAYLLSFLIGCAVLMPAAIVVGRRMQRPVPVSVLYAMTLAAVGTFTLPLEFANMYAFPAPQFSLSGFLNQFVSDSAPFRALTDLFTLPEYLANVMLYIPVGILGCLFLGKWWRALGTATILTFAVELVQAMSGFRDGSAIDFYHNSFGAAIGVAIVLGVRLSGLFDEQRSHQQTPREAKTAENTESA